MIPHSTTTSETCSTQEPRVVVVALHKSGANLIATLFRELGYTPFGLGIRDSYAVILEWTRKQRIRNPTKFFLDPVTCFETLVLDERFAPLLPPKPAIFVKALPLGTHLAHWSEKLDPPIVYHYRDPRSVVLSYVSYELNQAKEPHSRSAVANITSAIYQTLPNTRQRLMWTLKYHTALLEVYREHAWLLYHPAVCETSFEGLVGSGGGSSDELQLDSIRGVMNHLGIDGDPERVATELFNKNSRTFRKGRIDEWKTEFSTKALEFFEREYGDILELYGYHPKEAGPPKRDTSRILGD